MCNILHFLKNESYYYIAYNDTSRTPVMFQSYFDIEELGESTVTLKLPLRSCAQNHNISLIVSKKSSAVKVNQIPDSLDLPNTFILKGRVQKVHPQEQYASVILKLTSFADQDWNDMKDFYIKRQKEISTVIKRMRGYGE